MMFTTQILPSSATIGFLNQMPVMNHSRTGDRGELLTQSIQQQTYFEQSHNIQPNTYTKTEYDDIISFPMPQSPIERDQIARNFFSSIRLDKVDNTFTFSIIYPTGVEEHVTSTVAELNRIHVSIRRVHSGKEVFTVDYSKSDNDWYLDDKKNTSG